MMFPSSSFLIGDPFMDQPRLQLTRCRKRPTNQALLSPMMRSRMKLSSEWSDTMKLNILPTTADNLTVKIDKNKLNISGKSEEAKNEDGFESKSTHQWSQTLTIPDHVNHESIKLKLNEATNTITIESSKKNEDKTTLIPVTIE